MGAQQAGDDAPELDGVNFWSDADNVNLAMKNRQKLNQSMATVKPKHRAELAASVEIPQGIDNV